MSSGGVRGCVPLTNGPLQYMLRNRVYLGELNHRGESFPAEHAPIINPELFDAVQARLDANRQTRTARRHPSDAILAGLLHDDRGHRMGPSFAVKKGVRYRYYVSTATVQGRKGDAGSVSRVAAEVIETLVIEALIKAGYDLPSPTDRDGLAATVDRITVAPGRIEIRLVRETDVPSEPIVIAWTPRSQPRRREIIGPVGTPSDARPIRVEARSRLLDAIARARSWLDDIMTGVVDDIDTIAARESITPRTARMTLSLAFLAPDIVEAAMDGTLPRGFGVSRLTDLPPSWDEQRRVLGLAA